MNTLKRRVTLAVLLGGGIACISVALAIPALIPILVPAGCVLLSGGFGMFQSVIRSTKDNTANQERSDNENGQECDHVERNRREQSQAPNNSVNILFMYNQYNEATTLNETPDASQNNTLTLV